MTIPQDTSPLHQDKAKSVEQTVTFKPSIFTRGKRGDSLTPRDEEILLTLAYKVRCLDIQLVAEAWWQGYSSGRDAARLRLRHLVQHKWLSVKSTFARPLPILERPILSWKLTDERPQFGPISYLLKTRFQEPTRSTQVFYASPRSIRHFGAPKGREPRTSEVTHDLGLSAVYLIFRSRHPSLAGDWVSESATLGEGHLQGVKVPDALILSELKQPLAIEFGGRYGKKKLIAFHDYCAQHFRGYELW